MLHIAVFGSGRGSNFEAIISANKRGTLSNIETCLVLSNNSSAGILALARENGIPAVHLSQRQFSSEDEFVRAMRSLLAAHGVDHIVLAGYMKRIPPEVVADFPRRIINIHPALLPKFGGAGMYGHHVHRAVLDAGERESGATVHYVDDVYDHGEIIAQERVPVFPDDSVESLAARVLAVEHRLLPAALHELASRFQEKQ
jgi:phosphoribosylglycinamide formyltransferase 1